MEPSRRRQIWTVVIVIAFCWAALAWLIPPVAPTANSSPARSNSLANSSNTVTLKAKPWNNGLVHVWASIVELPGVQTKYTDVREGTRCTRLDNKTHRLIGDPPPIYYYRVKCNDIIGYVEIDQVR